MTTIAWRAPFMVCDGRVTEGRRIWTDKCEKITVLPNGALIGTAGAYDSRPIEELFMAARKPANFPLPKAIADLHIDFRSIIAWPDGSVWCLESGPKYKQEDDEQEGEVNGVIESDHESSDG